MTFSSRRPGGRLVTSVLLVASLSARGRAQEVQDPKPPTFRADVAYVLLERGSSPPREVLEALEPWKPVLEHRAEIRRNDREWWETAWPRDRDELAAPKVIALYRTDRGRFALDELGEWKPGKKAEVSVATRLHRDAG